MLYTINGIQQVGIGVSNADEAWAWYRKNFGMNVPVFKDAARAELMLKYTRGKGEDRYAILALNMKGGGGFEIWEYKSRKAEAASIEPTPGNLGMIAVKMKSSNINAAHQHLKNNNVPWITEIQTQPDGRKHFFVKDPYNNLFQIVEFDNFYSKKEFPIGGVCGVIVGVSNTQKSLSLYQNLLNHNQTIYSEKKSFLDLKLLENGELEYTRTLIRSKNPLQGPFSKLLGDTEIELLETPIPNARHTFENRQWGDLGYIHLCFDITKMKEFEKFLNEKGFPFTVDSSTTFDMGKAAGHFTYIEDPDSTLIEFVEAHKVPIFEKLGIYIHLKNRKVHSPLPDIIIKAMGLKAVK